MFLKILGEIGNPETIAAGTSVRQRRRLKRLYGEGRWRKLKGLARVELAAGEVRNAEVHWYEASGIGRREIKIKRFIERMDHE